jgi:AcrR family transcriptional regulator
VYGVKHRFRARAKKTRNRPPLTRERALRAAVELADREGLAELSMRRLAAVLGVEAMSLYHHVPNKEAILSGMVDLVFAEIDLPPRDGPWQSALRRRMSSMREVLVRHRWALRILESPRAPGAITMMRCSVACATRASPSTSPRTPSPCSTATSSASCTPS